VEKEKLIPTQAQAAGVQSPEGPIRVSPDSSLVVAILLTLSGGFLDAFTYVGHGQVFANSMTGNVVFVAISSATGNWNDVIRHILPIGAFLIGIFVAHGMRLPNALKYLPRPALTCLAVEAIFLLIASFLPGSFPDLLLVLGISFVAAMQNSSFTRLESFTYNSVMTTGNLRRFAEAFFRGTMPKHDSVALREARLFGLVCLSFLIGAAIGALCTNYLYNKALWAPTGMLMLAFYFCMKHGKNSGEPQE
jgi:uncharacterized membrane protein YoaK (UPF0700 family)